MSRLKKCVLILIISAILTSCTTQQDVPSSEPLSTPPEETNILSPTPAMSEAASSSQIDPLIVKENNLLLFQPENKEQDIYILGTIHSSHFIKDADYSLVNVQSVIDTINPDILLIEIRQETFEKYDALDGPIDMIFAWSYAKEKGIEVKGIDWWQITEDSRPLTTDTERDDHIFENILSELGEPSKVLILYGATHRIEQDKRFVSNGYIKCQLQNIEQYFSKVSDDDFIYPPTMASEIQKKIAYLQTEGIDEIKRNTTTGGEAQETYLKNNKNLIATLNSIMNELVIPNKLYSE